MSGWRVAVLGATGLVGRTLMEMLQAEPFQIDTITALASHRSAGERLRIQDQSYTVVDADGFDFSTCDIAFFSAGGQTAQVYAPIATKQGCVVIDNSSAYRMEDDVPLIIPQINPKAISLVKKRGIIANPNCSTIQLLLGVFPIYQQYGIKRIDVCTYQAVSGAGVNAMAQLNQRSEKLLAGEPVGTNEIAFNAVPHIDTLMPNGFSKEELKLFYESRKILGDSKIEVVATAVRVPVFNGHSEAVHIQCKKAVSLEDLEALYAAAQSVLLCPGQEIRTARSVVGLDDVFVSRLRADLVSDKKLCLWLAADNIRIGAATNACRIGKLLTEHLVTPRVVNESTKERVL